MADRHRDLTVIAIGYQYCGHFHKLVSVKMYKEHHQLYRVDLMIP